MAAELDNLRNLGRARIGKEDLLVVDQPTGAGGQFLGADPITRCLAQIGSCRRGGGEFGLMADDDEIAIMAPTGGEEIRQARCEIGFGNAWAIDFRLQGSPLRFAIRQSADGRTHIVLAAAKAGWQQAGTTAEFAKDAVVKDDRIIEIETDAPAGNHFSSISCISLML